MPIKMKAPRVLMPRYGGGTEAIAHEANQYRALLAIVACQSTNNGK